MQVKEVYVSIENAEIIFEIIRNSLNETKDIQIFIANKLLDELKKNGYQHHVYQFNGLQCSHYDENDDGFGGETWYGYHEDHAFSPLISSASFISNCDGYYQLVEFPNKKYLHFDVGFKELLLIEVDTSKNNS